MKLPTDQIVAADLDEEQEEPLADWVEGEEAEMVAVDRQMFVLEQEGLMSTGEPWYS